jgi:hypothetical protein
VPVRVAYDHHIGPVEKRRASGIEIWKELEECRSKSATQRRALFYDLLKRRVAPGSRQKALTPLQRRRILSRSCPGIGAILMDRFVTPSECWQQAALCRARADAAADERLRAVWMSMALIWTKLAAHKERLQRLKAWGT